MWVLLYRDGTTRKFATLGVYSKMSKAQAEEKREQLVAEANARNANAPDPHITFGEFLETVALPFLRSKWKRSTAATTENRIQHHLNGEFRERRITDTPRLRFPTGVRDAYGARVTVKANGLTMIQDMIPTSGYLSGQDPRLNFGLGKADHADSIEIRWPDGQKETFKNVGADRFVVYLHRTSATPRGSAKAHFGS